MIIIIIVIVIVVVVVLLLIIIIIIIIIIIVIVLLLLLFLIILLLILILLIIIIQINIVKMPDGRWSLATLILISVGSHVFASHFRGAQITWKSLHGPGVPNNTVCKSDSENRGGTITNSEGRKEMLLLLITTHSTHFIYCYMASDIR